MTEKPPWEKSGALPGERDFDPDEGDLDARVAWDHFGGLTLAEAYRAFQDHSEEYAEDFKYMGGKAFAYYFPVLERYLLVTPVWREEEGVEWCQILGLGAAIQFQFTQDCLTEVRELAPHVLQLISYVKESIKVHVASGHPYISSPEIHGHVIAEWDALEQHLHQFEEQ
ncbi:hypothetical protein [Gimesia sp.]|uniref:hypothetical protein n=1 Tax=Gimesia sp. TaxID=2024833 RepID=UPI003A90D07C